MSHLSIHENQLSSDDIDSDANIIDFNNNEIDNNETVNPSIRRNTLIGSTNSTSAVPIEID